LGSLLDWRKRRPIELVVNSCAGEGSSYDPDRRRIDLCYEEVAETRELLREAGQRRTDDAVTAVLLETVYHEVAHALIDQAGVKVPGNEEDAADRFAVLMQLRKGEDGVPQVLYAADAWAAYDELYEDDPADRTDSADRRHAHAFDRERAADLRCYAYGATPAARRSMLGLTALPAARAAGCADEWESVRAQWTKALEPVLRSAEAGAV
jgi:hypothetical protein